MKLAEDFLEQVSRHRIHGQLEGGIDLPQVLLCDILKKKDGFGMIGHRIAPKAVQLGMG